MRLSAGSRISAEKKMELSMTELILAVANKAYSSWSLRGWLALKLTGAPFTEVVVPLREPATRTEILKYSPSAKLPALIDGDVTVWESLAIVEYLAEKYPNAPIWPQATAARAHARAIASEMHGDMIPLRRALPMNLRHKLPCPALTDPVQADINRVQSIWREARRRFDGTLGEGPFLFGDFSGADAMFAPVAARFDTFGVALEDHAAAYVAAVMEHPLMTEWRKDALREPWIIPEFEPDNTTE
ncbi:MAG: glutathione S-transferase [Alphaproteobacteria bacterium]